MGVFKGRRQIGAVDEKDEILRFGCCICGNSIVVARDHLHRELVFCPSCGSNTRFRALMLALLRLVYQNDLVPLVQQPPRPDVSALGISDSDIYADVLARRLSYRNTFLHTSPFLDLCNPQSIAQFTALDLIICSDVIEHTRCLPETVLKNLHSMLRPGGSLVLSAPTYEIAASIEWYGGARRLSVIQQDGKFVVEWETLRGVRYLDSAPCFHGGPGETLEMRIISHAALVEAAERVGFNVDTLEFAPEFGYEWPFAPQDSALNFALDGRILLLRRRI